MIPQELRVGRHEADTEEDRNAVVACALAMLRDPARIDRGAQSDLQTAVLELVAKRRRFEAAKGER